MNDDPKHMNALPDDEPAMDRATEEALLESIAEIEPGAPLRGAMHGRILKRIGVPFPVSDSFVTIRAAEGQWIEIAPGVRRKTLLRSGTSIRKPKSASAWKAKSRSAISWFAPEISISPRKACLTQRFTAGPAAYCTCEPRMPFDLGGDWMKSPGAIEISPATLRTPRPRHQ
jgi:hypothetical protein